MEIVARRRRGWPALSTLMRLLRHPRVLEIHIVEDGPSSLPLMIEASLVERRWIHSHTTVVQRRLLASVGRTRVEQHIPREDRIGVQ